jgi:hypothetical protein
MTVAELIEQLRSLDPDLPVVVETETHGGMVPGHIGARGVKVVRMTDVGWQNFVPRTDGDVLVLVIS